MTAPDGITVAICAYNAANRIGPTLAHLRAQACAGLAWEVILVDNGSTDGTAEIARSAWDGYSGAPLSVVVEARRGVGHARRRALEAARYELLAFVDDDNWLGRDWVRVAVDVMRRHPDAGACGGLNEPAYEVDPPRWFAAVSAGLALGPQGDNADDVTFSRGALWGAGLVIRRSAWRSVLALELGPRLPGRLDGSLMAAEDTQICLELRAAGWRLRYEPQLKLQHAIPPNRLQWQYLLALHRGSGEATPYLDAYHVALRQGTRWTLADRIRWSWPWQAAHALSRIARHPWQFATRHRSFQHGNADVLRLDEAYGRLRCLLTRRSAYARELRATVARIHAVQRTSGAVVGEAHDTLTPLKSKRRPVGASA